MPEQSFLIRRTVDERYSYFPRLHSRYSKTEGAKPEGFRSGGRIRAVLLMGKHKIGKMAVVASLRDYFAIKMEPVRVH